MTAVSHCAFCFWWPVAAVSRLLAVLCQSSDSWHRSCHPSRSWCYCPSRKPKRHRCYRLCRRPSFRLYPGTGCLAGVCSGSRRALSDVFSVSFRSTVSSSPLSSTSCQEDLLFLDLLLFRDDDLRRLRLDLRRLRLKSTTAPGAVPNDLTSPAPRFYAAGSTTCALPAVVRTMFMAMSVV